MDADYDGAYRWVVIDSSGSCVSCGEETGVGSIFYSDRRLIPGDEATPTTYLCSLCESRIRTARKGRRLTDDEVRTLAANGSMAALTWGGAGGGAGGGVGF